MVVLVRAVLRAGFFPSNVYVDVSCHSSLVFWVPSYSQYEISIYRRNGGNVPHSICHDPRTWGRVRFLPSPAKKMKLEPTSATTVEICLPHIESSSLVTRGRFTLVVRPFSLLTSTARQLKIPNPWTQPNEGDKLKAKGRQKQKSTIPRCFQNVSIALGKSVPTS